VGNCNCERSIPFLTTTTVLCPAHESKTSIGWRNEVQLRYSVADYRERQARIRILNEDELFEVENTQQVSASDYQTIFIPFGPFWGGDEIHALLTNREIRLREGHHPIPWMHDWDSQCVLDLGAIHGSRAPLKQCTIPVTIEWVTKNLGTQLTGSFQPTADEDFFSCLTTPPHEMK
jgi:hypothetical protein